MLSLQFVVCDRQHWWLCDHAWVSLAVGPCTVAGLGPVAGGGVQVWLEHADWRMQSEGGNPHLALQVLKKARQASCSCHNIPPAKLQQIRHLGSFMYFSLCFMHRSELMASTSRCTCRGIVCQFVVSGQVQSRHICSHAVKNRYVHMHACYKFCQTILKDML